MFNILFLYTILLGCVYLYVIEKNIIVCPVYLFSSTCIRNLNIDLWHSCFLLYYFFFGFSFVYLLFCVCVFFFRLYIIYFLFFLYILFIFVHILASIYENCIHLLLNIYDAYLLRQ